MCSSLSQIGQILTDALKDESLNTAQLMEVRNKVFKQASEDFLTSPVSNEQLMQLQLKITKPTGAASISSHCKLAGDLNDAIGKERHSLTTIKQQAHGKWSTAILNTNRFAKRVEDMALPDDAEVSHGSEVSSTNTHDTIK